MKLKNCMNAGWAQPHVFGFVYTVAKKKLSSIVGHARASWGVGRVLGVRVVVCCTHHDEETWSAAVSRSSSASGERWRAWHRRCPSAPLPRTYWERRSGSEKRCFHGERESSASVRPAARAELHTHSEGRDAGRVRDAEMGVASHWGRVGRPPFVRRYCLLVIKGLSQSQFFAGYARTHVALPSAHTHVYIHTTTTTAMVTLFLLAAPIYIHKLSSCHRSNRSGLWASLFRWTFEKVQKMKRKEPYCKLDSHIRFKHSDHSNKWLMAVSAAIESANGKQDLGFGLECYIHICHIVCFSIIFP